MSDILTEKLSGVTTNPGVYLMKDAGGEVIYVGKALNLKKRLSSYFISSDSNRQQQMNLKTGVLIKKIVSFETIITGTEKEALILESNLIKKYKPRYNVILKDDKRYPSLRLDIKSKYPNLKVIRIPKNDNAMYFGPFSSSGAVRQTLKLIHKTFKLRKCTTSAFKKRTRPCLNFQMGMCFGPCCNEIDQSMYEEAVKEVILFLKGRTPALVKEIKDKMQKASQAQDYELAAAYRDKMFSIQQTLEKQIAVTADFMDKDVFAVIRDNEHSVITLLTVRSGYLQETRHFSFKATISSDSEMLGEFIRQYYEKANIIPDEVIVSKAMEDTPLIEEWLIEIKGEKVRIFEPKKGERFELVKMAIQNAEKELNEIISSITTSTDLLARLQKRFGMDRMPIRIECFDNSNISGKNPVSAMVVFENAKPAKSLYRKYSIKTVPEHNDYAYMAEALTRRFRINKEKEITYPDLLMIDGGKGHINIVYNILNEMNLTGKFELIGIAKKDETRGEQEDKIYQPGRSNPVNFTRERDLLYFLERIRDEAHRFAISFHRKQIRKKSIHSALDDIDGIGKKKKQMLLKHFGSIKKIKAATPEELSALPGITVEIAKSINEVLRTNGGFKNGTHF
ncbi:MAG: excinuclease ABC subunit UvrC [Proteobacteria bacterium]|nr:excinuclease ABC subunit UvrC [Pseudomonadota bacterium]MBU4011523.1 excinuclease ABC subunit UvrC [Pseudomonadota bacterium]